MLYKAFISYSHAADGKLAPALQRALERFGRAWYQRAAIRIFRDDTNLSISPGLWSSIESALSQSEYFLLFCSNESARSKWVRREVDYWKSRSPSQKLLIILTGGEVVWDADVGDFDWSRTALPPNLAKVYPEEPLYVDLRWARTNEDLSLLNPRFREHAADILATLTERPKDELIGEDVRVRRTARRWAWSVSSLLFVLLLAATAGGVWAFVERNAAQTEAEISLARQLGAQAELVRTLQGRLLQRSILLAIESARLVASLKSDQAPSLESDQALRNSLALQPEQVLRIPHKKPIEALAVSPDGKRLAVIDENDKTANILDIKTGASLFTVAHDDRITSVAFSPDGKLLATGSWDQTLRLWNTTDYAEIARLPHRGIVDDVAFSRDGRHLASGSGTTATGRPDRPPPEQKGWVRVWTLGSGKQADLREVADIPLEGDVFSLAFHPAKDRIAASVFGTARVFDFHSRKELWRVESNKEHWRAGSEGAVEGVAFSSDGRYFAFGVFDGYAFVHDVRTQRLVGAFGGRNDGVRRVAFASDNLHLVTGGSDDTVRVWNLDSAEETRRIAAHPNFALSADSSHITVAGEEEIAIWDWTTEPINATTAHPSSLSEYFFSADSQRVIVRDILNEVWTSDAHTGNLLGHVKYGEADYPLAASPNGTLVVVAGAAQRATVEQADEGRRVHAVLEHVPQGDLLPGPTPNTKFVRAARFSPDGNRLVTSALDQSLRFWSVPSWTLERAVSIPGRIDQIEFSGDSKRVLAIITTPPANRGESPIRRIVIWEADSASQLADLQLPARPRQSTLRAAISRDGTRFALILDPRSAKLHAELLLWETAGSRQIARIEGQAPFSSISFSPDGTLLAAASEDGTVRLLDTRTGFEVAAVRHEGWVRDVTFDGSGQFLATASDDNTSRVWEISTRREVARMKQSNGVLGVRFSPNGKLILNELDDARTSVWPWRYEELVAEACRRLTRNLTAEEWRTYLPGEPRKTCQNLP